MKAPHILTRAGQRIVECLNPADAASSRPAARPLLWPEAMPPRYEPVETWERRPGAATAPLGGYRRREPEKTLLHQVVRERLEPFLASARERSATGRGLPSHVERDLRSYLDCDILGRGFPRFRCPDCGFSLHAGVRIHGHDREGLERLCRHAVRPPFALHRLSQGPGGNLLYKMKRARSGALYPAAHARPVTGPDRHAGAPAENARHPVPRPLRAQREGPVEGGEGGAGWRAR